jgi:hypothetical protein
MKPFKETKAYEIAKKYLPQLASTLADEIPGASLAKSIVRIITQHPASSSMVTAEELQHLQDFEREMTELENADRSNARNREIEIAKTTKHDWLMYAAGTSILLAFILVVIAAVFLNVEGTNYVRTSTMVETLTVALVSYYFGSSKGSKDKTDQLLKTKEGE